MIPTWEPIASVDVAGANTVDFTSISADYTDLILVYHTSTNNTSPNDIWVRYNSDSGTNYSYVVMSGYGAASTISFRGSSQDKGLCDFYAAPSSTARALGMIQIMSYANTNFFKTALCATARQDLGTDRVIHTWRSTAAITSISVFVTSITVTGTFALYGVGNANLAQQATGVQATGGDEVFIANGYKHHIFRSSGSLSVSQGGNVEYLVVAGGGGGGSCRGTGSWGDGGGGGAGGYLTSTASLSATTHTVTVGAGGAGGALSVNAAGSGSNSSLGAVATSIGGGGGTAFSTPGTPTSGGSGGGGANSAGAAGTAGQGFAGGAGVNIANHYGAGGGGGAGAVGVDGTASTGGAGGPGLTSTITGISVTYAGGGGGGTYNGGTAGLGGSGGGGAGATGTANNNGNPGTANTGGGGGGAGTNAGSSGAATSTGGAGGSGIVIVRYPVS